MPKCKLMLSGVWYCVQNTTVLTSLYTTRFKQGLSKIQSCSVSPEGDMAAAASKQRPTGNLLMLTQTFCFFHFLITLIHFWWFDENASFLLSLPEIIDKYGVLISQ